MSKLSRVMNDMSDAFHYAKKVFFKDIDTTRSWFGLRQFKSHVLGVLSVLNLIFNQNSFATTTPADNWRLGQVVFAYLKPLSVLTFKPFFQIN